MTDEVVRGRRREGRVLVVDAVPSITLAVEIWLQRAGYTCVRAHSRGEALDQLAGTAFDLIVVDPSLPETSATDFVEELKGQVPSLPILVMTGTPLRSWGALTLADDWVAKPFRVHDLSRRLKALLEGWDVGAPDWRG